MPPARETGTGLVGSAIAAPAFVVSPAEADPEPEEAVSVTEAVSWVADAVSSILEAEGAEVASWLLDRSLLTAEAVTVLVRCVHVVEDLLATVVSLLPLVSLAEVPVAVPLADAAPVLSGLGAAVVVPFAA